MIRLRKTVRKVLRFAKRRPARVRAFVLALLVLTASFVPGLPVDLIDAVVVASLALAGGETAHRTAVRRSKAL